MWLRCSHWSHLQPPNPRLLPPSSTKPSSTHRSSPLHPHCMAVNRFTIYWINALSKEINGCVYEGTNGFYEKYFERRVWSATAEEIVKDASPKVINGKWSDYPETPSQDAFLEWFWGF